MFLYNLYNFMTMLNSTTILGGGETPVPGDAVEGVAEGAARAGGAGFFGGGDMMSMLLIYAAVIGGMYFLLIRPQRKREKTLREMQSSLEVGDDVITSSGFFGNIVSIGDDSFIIEFGSGKGVRIPVRKQDVIGKQSPKTTTTN